MKISKEIADKVARYRKLKAQTNVLYRELKEYFEEELELDGFEDAFIAEKPQGTKLSADGEFCCQVTLGEDWYRGKYYYPIENSDKYVGCSYEI